MDGFDEAARQVAHELSTRFGIDADVSIDAAPDDRHVLARIEGWLLPLEFEQEVDRDRLTPTSVSRIAATIAALHGGETGDEKRERRRSALADTTGYAAMLPDAITLALVDDGATARYALHSNALRGNLARRWVRHVLTGTTVGMSAEGTPIDHERRAADAIRRAGSRRAALRICSVTAAAVRAEPTRWRDRLAETVDARAPGDAPVAPRNLMQTGLWAPLIPLAAAVTWRRDVLTIEDGMPEAVAAACVGRTLRDVFDHPWLPRTRIARRVTRANGAIDLHVLAAEDRRSGGCLLAEPMAPLVDQLGIELRE